MLARHNGKLTSINYNFILQIKPYQKLETIFTIVNKDTCNGDGTCEFLIYDREAKGQG